MLRVIVPFPCTTICSEAEIELERDNFFAGMNDTSLWDENSKIGVVIDESYDQRIDRRNRVATLAFVACVHNKYWLQY